MNGTRTKRKHNGNGTGMKRKKNGIKMEWEWNENRMGMEQEWNKNGTRMEQERNGNKTKMKREQNEWTNGDCTDDDTAKQSMSASSTMMVCRRIFFFFFSYFMFFCFLLSKLLHGLLTTWLQAQKHTKVHSPDANLKTHEQGKQVYVGLHHLVQILYYNQTLCVCVCMLPSPKAGSKTNFRVARSFLPLKLLNSELHNL